MSNKELDPNKRIIKKYQNRKLYDTKDSKYVTLDDIAIMIKKGEEILVIDNQTKGDVTAIILTQILYDQEKFKKSILPLTMLKNIIQSGSGSLYEFLQKFVVTGMNNVTTSRVDTERYIDRLVKKGDITKGEGKAIVKELNTAAEKNMILLEKRLGDKITDTLKKASKLGEIEEKITSLTTKIDNLEKKLGGIDSF
ncbi:MAG: polyhydroxyalkanoate synthesis regulator DNA-binding domain-containing protein [Pseudomonadota bacterium]